MAAGVVVVAAARKVVAVVHKVVAVDHTVVAAVQVGVDHSPAAGGRETADSEEDKGSGSAVVEEAEARVCCTLTAIEDRARCWAGEKQWDTAAALAGSSAGRGSVSRG